MPLAPPLPVLTPPSLRNGQRNAATFIGATLHLPLPNGVVFYIIKNRGLEESQKFVKNIPEEAIKLAEELSLDFYEKYNPNYLTCLPKDIRNEIINKLTMAEILPYNETDWKEFIAIRDYLTKYNTVMKNLSDDFS